MCVCLCMSEGMCESLFVCAFASSVCVCVCVCVCVRVCVLQTHFTRHDNRLFDVSRETCFVDFAFCQTGATRTS